MDLTFSEEQRAIIDLAERILGDACGPERLRAIERDGTQMWPRDAWTSLSETGLVGIGLPESVGGGGRGLLEAMLVVEAVARAAAPLPAYASMILGAAPIARFGSRSQQERWLPGVAAGATILTGALVGENDSRTPAVVKSHADGRTVLSGTAWYVPYAADADAIVTVVDDGGERILVVVPRDAPGLRVESLTPISGEPTAIVHLEGVVVDADAVLPGSVGVQGTGADWLEDHAVAATCVAQVGTCDGAVALTAGYVSTREQFGVKLATLQAVSQRAADAWIDTEVVRLTAWAAAWCLSEGLDASAEIHTAKFFAAEAAQRVVAAAQHLHGGIGLDLDYPVHRYFRFAKEHEQRLGGGADHLAALGRRLADP